MTSTDSLILDLTDDELRASHRLKWQAVDADVLPAWIAEMDFALAEPITEALLDGVRHHALGYPGQDVDVVGALVAQAQRRYGWSIDPARVCKTPTVLGGLKGLIGSIAEAGPVALPTPSYPPFLVIPGEVDHEMIPIETDPWTEAGAQLPLEGIAAAIEAGARTLILCNPHNPMGRAWRRDELEALRDIVEPAGVLVISDEIHAPITMPGVSYTPYLTVASPDAPAITLLSSTKAFNCPGQSCAQVVWNREEDQHRACTLNGQPGASYPATHSLADIAALAAYEQGDAWLEALSQRIQANEALLRSELAAALPEAKMLPVEATYLAWVNLRGCTDDPAPAGRLLEHGRVRVGDGFGPGSEGCVRVNMATSPQRIREIVARMARGLGR